MNTSQASGENSDEIKLGGIWSDISVSDEDIEEAKTSLFEEVK